MVGSSPCSRADPARDAFSQPPFPNPSPRGSGGKGAGVGFARSPGSARTRQACEAETFSPPFPRSCGGKGRGRGAVADLRVTDLPHYALKRRDPMNGQPQERGEGSRKGVSHLLHPLPRGKAGKGGRGKNVRNATSLGVSSYGRCSPVRASSSSDVAGSRSMSIETRLRRIVTLMYDTGVSLEQLEAEVVQFYLGGRRVRGSCRERARPARRSAPACAAFTAPSSSSSTSTR